jgi:hypothetical protein
MTRISIFLATIALFAVGSQMAQAAQIRFHTKQYGCELTVFGAAKGRVEPEMPLTIDLPRGREYLVECESHDIHVKLYSRDSIFVSSSLPTDYTLDPVAVLPNVLRAAAEGKISVIAAADSRNVACHVTKKDPNSPFQDESHQIAPERSYQVKKGTVVRPTVSPQLHCGDTNLIELFVDGSTAWFRNKDFSFFYNGSAIPLYRPSQDFECCRIE